MSVLDYRGMRHITLQRKHSKMKALSDTSVLGKHSDKNALYARSKKSCVDPTQYCVHIDLDQRVPNA